MERYPLSWPIGWPRTPAALRKRAQFSKGERQYGNAGVSYMQRQDLTVANGISRVLAELGRLGVVAGDSIISTNVETRLDGLPYSNRSAPGDPGVAVYWRTRKHEMKVMAVDRYDRVADNLAAVAATLDAMRAIERHGGAQILDRAFTGFDALPNPARKKDWREVLGHGNGTHPMTLDAARRRYRELAAEHHPDRGGSSDKMAEINRAWQDVQAELAAGQPETGRV